MLKLNPIRSEKIWGYEQWIASTHPDGKQQDFAKAIGGDYPLLVKVIQANDTLSIQVHPNDEEAARLENDSRGKTECWYVLNAEPGAELVVGLNESYSTEELKHAICHNTLEKCLNRVEVHPGDFIFIPSGTVHAIGKGLRLLEVQQSSNITYRLYDWGRQRELHVDKGLQVIKNRGLQEPVKFQGSFDCDYFRLEENQIESELNIEVPAGKEPFEWLLLFVLSGEGQINSADNSFDFKAEDIFAVAPSEKIKIQGNAEIMKIICRK